MYFVIAVIVVQIVCALIMQSVAKKRNASESFWLLMGLVFGPLALIAIPFIKNKL